MCNLEARTNRNQIGWGRNEFNIVNSSKKNKYLDITLTLGPADIIMNLEIQVILVLLVVHQLGSIQPTHIMV